MYNIYEKGIQKEICCSHLPANSSTLCAAAWLQLHFLCPVPVRVRPKSLLSSRRLLCLVAVRLWLKSLLSSGLSSAEMAASAIPIEKTTPERYGSVLKDNAQWADVIGLA